MASSWSTWSSVLIISIRVSFTSFAMFLASLGEEKSIRKITLQSTEASPFFVEAASTASPAVHPERKLLKSLSCCGSILWEIHHPVDLKWSFWLWGIQPALMFQRSFTQKVNWVAWRWWETTLLDRKSDTKLEECWSVICLGLFYLPCCIYSDNTLCCDMEKGGRDDMFTQ